jgi:hypothetical protein
LPGAGPRWSRADLAIQSMPCLGRFASLPDAVGLTNGASPRNQDAINYLRATGARGYSAWQQVGERSSAKLNIAGPSALTASQNRETLMNRCVTFAAAGAVAFGLAAGSANGQGSTVASVKQRGLLNCGVNSALPGFSQSDGQGHWQGFDVDYCRAIAAAVLGDPARVNYVPLPRLERFATCDRAPSMCLSATPHGPAHVIVRPACPLPASAITTAKASW